MGDWGKKKQTKKVTCQSFRICLVGCRQKVACPLPGILLQTHASVVIRARRQLGTCDLSGGTACRPFQAPLLAGAPGGWRGWKDLSLRVLPSSVREPGRERARTVIFKAKVSIADCSAFAPRGTSPRNVWPKYKIVQSSCRKRKTSEAGKITLANFKTPPTPRQARAPGLLVFLTCLYLKCTVEALS